MALTFRQKRFVEEYLIDPNATQAAIRAGYAKSGAAMIGYYNMKKPEIQKALAEAQAERIQRTRITQDWALERLKLEAELEGPGSSHRARVSALGLAMKHLGMLKEDAPHPDRLPFDLSKLTDDSLERLVVILAPIFAPVALGSAPTGTGMPEIPTNVE